MRKDNFFSDFPVFSFLNNCTDFVELAIQLQMYRFTKRFFPHYLKVQGKIEDKKLSVDEKLISRSLSNILLLPGYIVGLSLYFDVDGIMTLKKVNKRFNQDLSNSLVVKKILIRYASTLFDIPKVLHQSPKTPNEYKLLFDATERKDEKMIHIENLNPESASTVIRYFQQVAKIHRVYQSLVPLRRARGIVSAAVGNRTFRYSCAGIIIVSLLARTIKKMLNDAYIMLQQPNLSMVSLVILGLPLAVAQSWRLFQMLEQNIQNIPPAFNQIVDIITTPLRFYRERLFNFSVKNQTQLPEEVRTLLSSPPEDEECEDKETQLKEMKFG